jgi:hypothetical protein
VQIQANCALTMPGPAPSNKITRLQQDIATRTHPSFDTVHYHITFRFGVGILVDLPRRLGKNKALDDAAAAILARHAEVARREDQTDPNAASALALNKALASLRVEVRNSGASVSTETLCAVVLLAFCQVCRVGRSCCFY